MNNFDLPSAEQICELFARKPTEELYQEISLRADDLEAFYLEHDSDSRAILIDRIRVRLQSALQSDSQSDTLQDMPEAEEKDPSFGQVGGRRLQDIDRGSQRRQPQQSQQQPVKRSGGEKGKNYKSSKSSTSKALYTWEREHWKNQRALASRTNSPPSPPQSRRRQRYR